MSNLHSNLALATQEDLDRFFGSENLPIGTLVRPKQPSGEVNEPSEAARDDAEGEE